MTDSKTPLVITSVPYSPLTRRASARLPLQPQARRPLPQGARKGSREFINADTIASGLSAFRPESVAISAGRMMIRRMHDLAAARSNFAFETTLASRSLAPWIQTLKKSGYRVYLLFLWLRNADLAVSRVKERTQLGGHDVPEAVVRRRYAAGLTNLFSIYLALSDIWQLFDNSERALPRPIAAGAGKTVQTISNREVWENLSKHGE